MRPRALRALAIGLVLSMVAAACGSRIDEDARALAIAGAGSEVVRGADPAGGAASADDPDRIAAPPTDEASEIGDEPGQERRPADDRTAPTGPQAQRPGDADRTERRDTRHAPAGGNGGATDVGVSEDRIVISNVSDVSGAVPGLFEDAQLAVQAYFAMFAATEGTVYGRRIEVRPRDARLDTTGNRVAYLAACEDSFAVVGSMSAFEEGAAPVIAECGIPDLRTAGIHPQIMELPQVWPANMQSPNLLPVAEFVSWMERHPEAAQNAAYLFVDGDVTRFQTARTVRGTERLGWNWIYYQSIDIAETNYAPFVLELRNRGVRFVAFQGAYQQAVRLAQAMRQQNYWPDIYALQANAYTPDFITTGGAAVEGTRVTVPNVLLEEIDEHPELEVYAEWVRRIRPGEQPTGLGMFAWSAAKLFVEAVKEVGPELTRERLLRHLSSIDRFDGGGLIVEQHLGERIPSGCMTILEVRDGRFQRVDPRDGGFRCEPLVDTSG